MLMQASTDSKLGTLNIFVKDCSLITFSILMHTECKHISGRKILGGYKGP